MNEAEDNEDEALSKDEKRHLFTWQVPNPVLPG